eukprot:686918-Heterocapsa_arctica.AAC.1
MELSKELASTNDKWKRKVEELAGISLELAELGWAAMDGDSDFEEEDEQQVQLDYQLQQEQLFAQKGAKGKGKFQEGVDADMGIRDGDIEIPDPEQY